MCVGKADHAMRLRTTFAWVVPSLITGVYSATLLAQVSVLTFQYDNSRAGANLNETILTPGNVTSDRFGKLFSYEVDGVVYAQPLYLANVNVPGRGAHDVVYVATEHDSVYAFDARSNDGPNAQPLWRVSFIDPDHGVNTVLTDDVNCVQISPEIGITSTPVIDSATGTIFVVAMTKETADDGSDTLVHRLHALDVTTGAEKPGSPVIIQASVPGGAEDSGTVYFNPAEYKERAGLLLVDGVVYTSWASHCDLGEFHGWVMAYNAKTLDQVAVYNTTPNGKRGAIWQGGAAPAADAEGNIYLVTGDGTFDYGKGGTNLGDTYIKFSPGGALVVADYFTPFNADNLDEHDADLGSSGVVLLPDEAGTAAHSHLMVGAGKEGRIYVIDRDQMGNQQAGADRQIVQSFPNAIGPLFTNPAYFQNTMYFCAARDSLKAFPISNGMLATTPSSQTAARFAFRGCAPSISANGSSNGILWMIELSGTLRAYDASNLGLEVYNSNQNSDRDRIGREAYVPFSVPMIANGRVYVGTANQLMVYGLF